MAKAILLIEDSADDELLCRLALQKVIANPVVAVGDGGKAIDYLSGQGD